MECLFANIAKIFRLGSVSQNTFLEWVWWVSAVLGWSAWPSATGLGNGSVGRNWYLVTEMVIPLIEVDTWWGGDLDFLPSAMFRGPRQDFFHVKLTWKNQLQCGIETDGNTRVGQREVDPGGQVMTGWLDRVLSRFYTSAAATLKTMVWLRPTDVKVLWWD